MAFTIIENPYTPGVEGTLDQLPLKDSGAQWRMSAIFNNGQNVVLADSYTGILSAYVDEYEEADFSRKGVIREFLAKEVQRAFNENVLNGAENLTQEQKDILADPTPFKDSGEGTNEWTADVPLLISVNDYAPNTDLPKPTGKMVIEIDSLIEERLVKSMDTLGIIVLLPES